VKCKELPSYYMDNNVYGSFIRDPIAILLRREKGGRNFMWSTDYPHSETTWPRSRDELNKQFRGLSEPERRAIVCDNALRFYGITA